MFLAQMSHMFKDQSFFSWCQGPSYGVFPINYHSYLDSYSKFLHPFFPRSKVQGLSHPALKGPPWATVQALKSLKTSLAPGSAGGLRAQPRTMAGITGKMMRNPWGFWPEKKSHLPIISIPNTTKVVNSQASREKYMM